jgi:type II secretory pathway component PulF
MQAIPFAVLMKAYPRKRDTDHDALFRLLGWDDLIPNPAYANTCAIRVSLALLRSGVHIPEGLQVKAGTHKGKMIEPGQAKIVHNLVQAVHARQAREV